MTSWEEVEELLASGDPEDTLAHLKSLDKILHTFSNTTKASLDENQLEFEYYRLPTTNYLDSPLNGKSILTMISHNYVDVLDCCEPIFADANTMDMDDKGAHNQIKLPITPVISPSVLLSASEVVAGLRGKSKDEVVPFLVDLQIPVELMVDAALSHFASA